MKLNARQKYDGCRSQNLSPTTAGSQVNVFYSPVAGSIMLHVFLRIGTGIKEAQVQHYCSSILPKDFFKGWDENKKGSSLSRPPHTFKAVDGTFCYGNPLVVTGA